MHKSTYIFKQKYYYVKVFHLFERFKIFVAGFLFLVLIVIHVIFRCSLFNPDAATAYPVMHKHFFTSRLKN